MTTLGYVKLPRKINENDEINYVPLGGDGMRSPQSAYDVKVRVNDDTQTGYIEAQIGFDPTFCQVLSWVSIQRGTTEADGDTVLCRLAQGPDSADSLIAAKTMTPTAPSGSYHVATWLPPAKLLFPTSRSEATPSQIDDPYLSVRVPAGPQTTNIIMWARIFNFRKEARDQVPIEMIFQCLGGRGGTIY